jgi:hypothetical protein
MEPTKKRNVSKPGMKSGAAVTSDGPDSVGGVAEDHRPSKMTLGENVALTIKILAIAGLIMASLWGINYWTSAN